VPIAPTYPGVYIEEIPSGVRTITGVATSITAFIGRTRRGPVNEPVVINNFGEFETVFGGLALNYPVSYAVRDFFQNGGGQAIVVRLYKLTPAPTPTPTPTAAPTPTPTPTAAPSPTPTPTPTATGIPATTDAGGAATLTFGGLTLVAASPGDWANDWLAVKVDYTGIDDQVAERFGVPKNRLFNLRVVVNPPGPAGEQHLNVTVKEPDGSPPSPRRLDRVLQQESRLIRVLGELPSTVPAETTADKDPTNPKNTVDKLDTFKGGQASLSLDTSAFAGKRSDKSGMFALENADLFNLLCIPPDKRSDTTPKEVYQAAYEYCVERRAMLIVDPPAEWSGATGLLSDPRAKLTELGLSGPSARNAALYFPRVYQADPLSEGQQDVFVPCGIVAGVMARTDVQRGVWKAPAGIDANLSGTQGLQVPLSDDENGRLNPLGINSLRTFPIVGSVVWGARTLRGADQLADEYKYVPVRRLALFIEESLFRGTQWVVFEPNDEPLWAQIRLNVGAFMQNLFVQGAFQGTTRNQAYFVKCDKETTTQNDINLGVVNIVVGFAPLKPAEFVIIKIQQMAGQVET
jgi:uncharacterized protein